MGMIILSIAYFAGAVFAASTSAGRIFPFPVVYRVIYIPLVFWALTLFYARLFRIRVDRPVNLSMIFTLAIPLHLIVVLLNSYFSVMINADELCQPYKIYIEALIYISLFLILRWGSRTARDCLSKRAEEKKNRFTDLFFLPVLYIFPYAVCLAAQSRNARIASVFIAIAVLNYFADSNKRISAVTEGLFRAVKAVFKDRRKTLLCIFIFAFAARLLFGINIIHKTKEAFPTASDDGTTYDIHACEMAKDASYIRNAAFAPTEYDTGYSFVLGLIYKIFGRSFYLTVILQSLAGSFVPVMAYLLSDMVVKRKAVSLLAGVWCSLDQSLIMYSAVLGQEAFYIPLVMFLVLLVTRYAVQRKKAVDVRNSILIGVSFGAAVLIRSAILLFLPLVIVYLVSLRGGKALLKKSVDIILILCVAAAMIAPVTYLNYLNSGKLYLLTKPKPILEWEFPDGDGYYFPGNTALVKIGVNPFKDPGGSVAKIARDPAKFLAIEGNILARRCVGFFFCYNFGYFDPIYLINSARIPNDFASNLEFYIALAVFAGFLFIIMNKERRKRAWPMLLMIFYYVLLHVIITRMGSSRYRAPVHPYLIIFGATGIIFFIDYVKKGLKRAQ